jgi:hypothetical protein
MTLPYHQQASEPRTFAYVRVLDPANVTEADRLDALVHQNAVGLPPLVLPILRDIGNEFGPFFERPAGRQLLCLSAGDHVIIPQIHYLGSSAGDINGIVRVWDHASIMVHLLDIGMNNRSTNLEALFGAFHRVESVNPIQEPKQPWGYWYRKVFGKSYKRPQFAEMRFALAIVRLREAGYTVERGWEWCQSIWTVRQSRDDKDGQRTQFFLARKEAEEYVRKMRREVKDVFFGIVKGPVLRNKLLTKRRFEWLWNHALVMHQRGEMAPVIDPA